MLGYTSPVTLSHPSPVILSRPSPVILSEVKDLLSVRTADPSLHSG
jgi:hypothetical protein